MYVSRWPVVPRIILGRRKFIFDLILKSRIHCAESQVSFLCVGCLQRLNNKS